MAQSLPGKARPLTQYNERAMYNLTIMKKLSIAFLACLLTSIGIYAFYVEPAWLEVTTHRIGTPPVEVIKVAHLSDLHLQEIGAYETRVIATIRQLDPDLMILSGDVIDKPDKLPVVEEFLSKLSGKRIVATLGNWEYWSKVDLIALRDIYTRHNVSLLVNAQETMTLKGRGIRIFGLDDFTAGSPRLNLLHAPLPTEIAILVEHSPGFFSNSHVVRSATNPPRFQLCLSGHTHAGQVAFFGIPLWTPRGSGEFTAGLYETRYCPMYVSRGIGTSLLPVRFGARPELAVFEL